MDNIYTVVENFLVLGKCLGFYPFSFDGPPRKGILRTKWYDVAASIFLLLTVSTYFGMNLYYHGFIGDASIILQISWGVSTNLEYLSFLILIGYQLHQRKSFKSLLPQLEIVDKKVVLLNMQHFDFKSFFLS